MAKLSDSKKNAHVYPDIVVLVGETFLLGAVVSHKVRGKWRYPYHLASLGLPVLNFFSKCTSPQNAALSVCKNGPINFGVICRLATGTN